MDSQSESDDDDDEDDDEDDDDDDASFIPLDLVTFTFFCVVVPPLTFLSVSFSLRLPSTSPFFEGVCFFQCVLWSGQTPGTNCALCR